MNWERAQRELHLPSSVQGIPPLLIRGSIAFLFLEFLVSAQKTLPPHSAISIQMEQMEPNLPKEISQSIPAQQCWEYHVKIPFGTAKMNLRPLPAHPPIKVHISNEGLNFNRTQVLQLMEIQHLSSRLWAIKNSEKSLFTHLSLQQELFTARVLCIKLCELFTQNKIISTFWSSGSKAVKFTKMLRVVEMQSPLFTDDFQSFLG